MPFDVILDWSSYVASWKYIFVSGSLRKRESIATTLRKRFVPSPLQIIHPPNAALDVLRSGKMDVVQFNFASSVNSLVLNLTSWTPKPSC
jgi:hypothetical protein